PLRLRRAAAALSPSTPLFRSQNPLGPDAMWLLAKIGMKLNILDDAELLLQSVVSMKPDDQVIRHDYAIVLALRHKHQRALEEIQDRKSTRLNSSHQINSYAGF